MKPLKMITGLIIILLLVNLNFVFAQDPIADYSFDADASDATGNFNGTLEKDAAIVNDGVRGTVLGLSDSGYVSIPAALADSMNSFSFAGWVKFNGTVNWAGLVGMGQDTAKGYPYFDYHLRSSGGMSFYSTKYQVWPSDGCSKTIDGYTVPKGEWVHIAFSFTVNDTAIVYVNGQAVATKNWKAIQEFDVAPDSLDAKIVTIGRDAFNQGTLTNTKIDEFKFYDEAITAEKVAEIYNAEVIAVEPIADYSFDVDASDAKGSYNGTLQGDAAIVNDAVRGQVLGLADSGFVSVPPAIASEMDDFSFCGWVKFNGTNPWSALVGMGSDTLGVHPYFDFHLKNDGSIRYYASVDGTWPPDGCSQIVDGYNVPVKEWTHIAFSFTKNDTGLVYINGVEQATVPWKDIQEFDVSPSMLAAQLVNIGKDAFNQQTLTNTKIDNFKFFKTNISANKVAEIYNDELITADEFIIAEYSFDVDASDATGNFNGTLEKDAAIVDDGVRGQVLGLADSGFVSVPPAIASEMDDFSWAGWVKFNGTVSWAGLVGMGSDTAGTFPYFDYHLRNTGGMSFYSTKYQVWEPDGCSKTIDGYTVPKGDWVHIAFSFTVNDTAIVYVNGQAVSTVSWKTIQEFDVAPDSLNAKSVTIGRDAFNQGTLTNTKIDNFKFYNIAITAGDVADIYNAELIEVEPIASYSFDSDASDATGSYNGTLQGDAAIVNDGLRGQVLGLADSGFVSVPPAIASEMDDFSFCGWVNFNGINAWPALMGMGTAAGGSHPYWDFHLKNDGSIRYYASVDGTWPPDGCSQIMEGYNVPVKEWTHIAFSFTKNDTGLVYINGVEQATVPWADTQEFDVSPSMLAAQVVNIGKDAFNQQTLTNTKIDNFKFFKTNISAGKVAEIYNDELITVEDFLVAHWKFDETSGTTANDEIASSDATLVNMGDSPWVAGWDGNAIDFSNKPDTGYVEVANNATVDMDSTESFTISFLVKADPVGNTAAQNLILKGTFDSSIEGHDGKRYQFEMKNSMLRFSVDDDVVKSSLDVVVTDFYPVNEWAHVVGVRDLAQDLLYLYLNGELIGSLADGTDMDISNNRSLVIGSSFDGSGKLDGQMDDLRMYNYALNADKVKALYDSYDIPVGINGEQGVKPMTYELMQNYPNPFNPSTTIQYQVPKDGLVTISVYNTLGQRVTTLVNKNMKTGIHQVTFDAAKFSSGIYFYRMKAKGFSKVKKMMLLK